MKLRNIALSLLAAVAVGSAAAADYSVVFNQNYDAASHPEISPAGYLSANGMHFLEGYGVSLTNVVPSSVYTIDTTFSFDVTDYWRKIIDFGGRTSDNGLYEDDGRISFYADGVTTDGLTTTITPGQTIRLTLTRDASSTVTAYLNGVQEFSFVDTNNAATFTSVAGFFIDDWASGGFERSPGNVKYIQVFNTALSAGDVASLTAPAAVPEPESLALALAGFMTVGFLMKRRRA